jgi:hypothetical protein
MQPQIASAVAVLAGALSVVVFLVSGAVLVVTARELQTRRLRLARLLCTLLSGLLVASTFAGVVEGWALVVSCLAFLASVQAVALAFGYLAPLPFYLDDRVEVGQADWWQDFERSFAHYAAWDRRRRRLRRGHRRVSAPATTDSGKL